MINVFRCLRNWFKLMGVRRTINIHRIDYFHKIRVKFSIKELIKRPLLTIIRIKVNGTTYGLLVASQKSGQPTITYIDFVWLNNKKVHGTPTEESIYYQALYNTFTTWYYEVILTPAIYARHRKRYGNPDDFRHTIAVPLNITKDDQKEQYRRILTLHGFTANPELSTADVAFKKPYREPETIEYVVYTRVMS